MLAANAEGWDGSEAGTDKVSKVRSRLMPYFQDLRQKKNRTRADRDDVCRLASTCSGEQDIAGTGAFTVAMLCDTEAMDGPNSAWYYRRANYECGALGQLLYVEAEAAGLRGTGMGFFDDCAVLRFLGLDLHGRFQDFYHFCMGCPEKDDRLM